MPTGLILSIQDAAGKDPSYEKDFGPMMFVGVLWLPSNITSQSILGHISSAVFANILLANLRRLSCAFVH
jgi:hypothetical protein